MTKLLTAVSSAVLLWTFWFASNLGVYVGTYTSEADGQLQCRYVTARGFFDEERSKVLSPRNLG